MNSLLLALSICQGCVLYNYAARLERAIDGDTFTAELVLRPGLTQKVTIRLLGVDAPEIHAKDIAERARALVAKHYLMDRLAGRTLIVHAEKRDSFGRDLGEVLVDGECFNDLLIREGIAKSWK